MGTRDPKAFPHQLGDVWVSDLQVLRSGAGFYLGRMCWSEDCGGLIEPYTRETGYMSEAETVASLASGEFDVRECPENDLAYAQGLPHPKGRPAEDFVKKVGEEVVRFMHLSDQASASKKRWS